MNRVIVITGASSGIGKELAQYFSKYDKVIGMSRTIPNNVEYDYLSVDVSNEDDVKKAVDIVSQKYGKVDVLINCAGIGISGAIEYTTLQEARQIIDVNIIGPFLAVKHFLPLIRNSKQGKIINIGSVAGELTIPFQTFYSMTKTALQAFTEGLKMELKPFGIDACCVLPGDTKTGFTAHRKQPVILEDEVYKGRIKRSIKRMERDEQNGMDPISVVRVVRKVLKRRHMPTIVTVGVQYKLIVLLSRILPSRLSNFILYQLYSK